MKEVFTGVLQKISAWKQTKDYENYLLDAAEKAKNLGGENGITVYLTLPTRSLRPGLRRLAV